MVLSNPYLEIEIQLPGEGYAGSRFDHTGKIIQIRFNDRTFCTCEKNSSDDLNSSGRGLYNEFGIDEPLGYSDCKIGERFLKIGVGLLVKETDDAYDFFRAYPVIPAETKVKNPTRQSVLFTSEVKPYRDYGYRLAKSICLDSAGFSIKYELQNTGKKPISTNEYVHNFLAINDKRTDNNYTLRFSSPFSKAGFGEFVDPEDMLRAGTDSISWKGSPSKDFFISHIFSNKSKGISWTLLHKEEKCGISETVDFPVQRLNLWGCGHVISPEIFYKINILPGLKTTWERNYKLSIFE
jgi:hypothetical protein